MNFGIVIFLNKKVFFSEYPNAVVCSFEPVLEYYEIAHKYLFNYSPNLHLFNLGISNQNEVNTIWIYGKEHIGWNTMLAADPNQSKGFTNKMTRQLVKCVTLSFFCQENKIHRIDIIKIDVEGFETKVLEGFFDFLITMKKKPLFLIEVAWGINHPEWNYCEKVYQKLFDIGDW